MRVEVVGESLEERLGSEVTREIEPGDDVVGVVVAVSEMCRIKGASRRIELRSLVRALGEGDVLKPWSGAVTFTTHFLAPSEVVMLWLLTGDVPGAKLTEAGRALDTRRMEVEIGAGTWTSGLFLGVLGAEARL